MNTAETKDHHSPSHPLVARSGVPPGAPGGRRRVGADASVRYASALAVRMRYQHAHVQEWVTAAIGVAGTLGGTGLGYRGALAISRRAHAAATRDRMRAALAEYLGTLYVSVAELRDLPRNKPPSWLDQQLDALRGEQGGWIARRRAEHELTGDRYRELAGRLAAAAAQLQVLPLPGPVREAVDAANEYIEQLGEQRTPQLKAKWGEVHARLMAAAKTLDG